MKYVLLIFLLLLTCGCDKKSKVEEQNGIFLIFPEKGEVEESKVVKWRVGPLRRQTVSKGVKGKIIFPVIERKYLKKFVDEFGIDSWLIRVRRRGLGRSEVLDRISVPLIVNKKGRKEGSPFRLRQTKLGHVQIYYAAAALSSRFENFQCPAFDHSLSVKKMRLRSNLVANNYFRLNPQVFSSVLGKVRPFDYKSNVVNGGMRLLGEYIFEIAFYNSKYKRTYSNFVTLSNSIDILQESQRIVKGCANFKIPKKKIKADPIKSFKFGGD